MRPRLALLVGALALQTLPAAWSSAGPAAPTGTDTETAERRETPSVVRDHNGLESLVPELAENPYRMEPGPRSFLHRLSFSPGYGSLGKERLFTFRLAYNPNSWLGYEGSIDHNPGESVHAALHSLSAIVRRPLPGRFQPYLTAGYGMLMVFPGQSLNADPVTKNTVSMGGGLEFYIRNDLALRADMRLATVFGRERDRDEVVVYDYVHQTVGLAFYRSIRP